MGITAIFPNVKELHFINMYKFDDIVLRALIEQINSVNNMVQKVVFLYFAYRGNDIPLESDGGICFYDPHNLNVSELEKEHWKLDHGPIGDGGYKISVWKHSISPVAMDEIEK